MKVYGVIGWKNAGKTGLMERLVAEITGRGFTVSTVKHVHHDVDLDQPGKDTFRHRSAGAREVVLASARRHAILTEHRDGPEPALSAILARLAHVDLVLVEGYKRDTHPKIEVWRPLTGQALIQPGDPHVRAVATDTALPPLPVPVLDLNDTGAVADFIAYDTLGIPISVRLTTVLESRTSTATTYRWFADSPDNDPDTGSAISVGTGLITFDGTGNFSTASESKVSVERRHVSSASPLEFDLNFNQLSGLATDTSTLAVSRQDGSAPGVLTSFIVGEDGRIRGVFSNGITRDLGQIVLARFANPTGLEQKGENMFAAGVNSGLPVIGRPNEQGIGSIIAGAQELSNTDIGGNLIDLILASTMYRGNTRVITTAQQMFDELLALNR